MDRTILEKIYNNDYYLEFLRNNPKWYYYLDSDPKNFKIFEDKVKRQYKITSYDKLEKIKGKINFVNSMVSYFTK